MYAAANWKHEYKMQEGIEICLFCIVKMRFDSLG